MSIHNTRVRRQRPNVRLGKGCLQIIAAIVGGFAILIMFAYCSDRKKNKADEARMDTLEGRASVLAERKFGEEAVVSITPQVDGGQRIKIEFAGKSAPGRSIRENVLHEVHGFLSSFYDSGSTAEVSSFWFDPQSTLVDTFGKESRGSIGKLVIDRLVTDKVSNWKNVRPETLGEIFAEEGTLWWHPVLDLEK